MVNIRPDGLENAFNFFTQFTHVLILAVEHDTGFGEPQPESRVVTIETDHFYEAIESAGRLLAMQ